MRPHAREIAGKCSTRPRAAPPVDGRRRMPRRAAIARVQSARGTTPPSPATDRVKRRISRWTTSGAKPRPIRKRDCAARSAASTGSRAKRRSRTAAARSSSEPASDCARSRGSISCRPARAAHGVRGGGDAEERRRGSASLGPAEAGSAWRRGFLIRSRPKRAWRECTRRFGKACVREEAIRLEPVEERIDFGGDGGFVAACFVRIRIDTARSGPIGSAAACMANQLSTQLDAALVALREQLQSARLERALRLHVAAAQSLTTFSLAGASSSAAPGRSGMPTAARTLFSISIARSGFSFRNSRALSLPWPIFSPL